MTELPPIREASSLPVGAEAGASAKRASSGNVERLRMAGESAGGGAGAGTMRKVRIVVAKVGLDEHDRGAKIIARALRDAGMEVIYTGLHQTPEQIVATVIQEDADAVGLSVLSGAHMTLVPRVVGLLREQGAEDVVLTVGGTIPAADVPALEALGIARVFTPGASTDEIVEFMRARAAQGPVVGEGLPR